MSYNISCKKEITFYVILALSSFRKSGKLEKATKKYMKRSSFSISLSNLAFRYLQSNSHKIFHYIHNMKFFIYCKKFAIHSMKSEFSCEVKRKNIFRVLLSGNKKFVQSQSQWLPYSLWQKYIRYNHFNWIEIQSMLQKKMKLCFHSFEMERETKMTGGWIS